MKRLAHATAIVFAVVLGQTTLTAVATGLVVGVSYVFGVTAALFAWVACGCLQAVSIRAAATRALVIAGDLAGGATIIVGWIALVAWLMLWPAYVLLWLWS